MNLHKIITDLVKHLRQHRDTYNKEEWTPEAIATTWCSVVEQKPSEYNLNPLPDRALTDVRDTNVPTIKVPKMPIGCNYQSGDEYNRALVQHIQDLENIITNHLSGAPPSTILDDLQRHQQHEVKIRFRHLYGFITSVSGKLDLDKDWAYLYDEGKSGSDYNGAFHIADPEQLARIVSVERINP